MCRHLAARGRIGRAAEHPLAAAACRAGDPGGFRAAAHGRPHRQQYGIPALLVDPLLLLPVLECRHHFLGVQRQCRRGHFCGRGECLPDVGDLGAVPSGKEAHARRAALCSSGRGLDCLGTLVPGGCPDLMALAVAGQRLRHQHPSHPVVFGHRYVGRLALGLVFQSGRVRHTPGRCQRCLAAPVPPGAGCVDLGPRAAVRRPVRLLCHPVPSLRRTLRPAADRGRRPARHQHPPEVRDTATGRAEPPPACATGRGPAGRAGRLAGRTRNRHRRRGPERHPFFTHLADVPRFPAGLS